MVVSAVSVNERSATLVDRLVHDAEELKIKVSRGELGEILIDAGSQSSGGIAAGIRIAEICMGGLGQIDLLPSSATPRWPWTLVVRSSNPVIACLASQYAGWRLSGGEGKQAYFALASGPGRALARKEQAASKALSAKPMQKDVSQSCTDAVAAIKGRT